MKNFVLNSKQLKLTGVFILAIFIAVSSPAFGFDFKVKDTDITIGGFIKMVTNYDIDNVVKTGPTGGDIFSPYLVALDGTSNADKDDFRMVARESRLEIKTKGTDTGFGTMQTVFSTDFYGDIGNETFSNSRALRIREAYGKVTNGKFSLLVGQTWSTFMDLRSLPSSMDFSVDPSICFIRQTMIRFQYNINKGQNFILAIENPDRGLTSLGPNASLYLNPGSSEDQMPDFIAKYSYSGKWGHISPRFILRRFKLDGDTALGWGATLSGSLHFGNGHVFQAGAVYGDGLGRYLALGAQGGAGLSNKNNVETIKSLGGYAAATFALSKALHWSIGLGYSEHDDDAYEDSDAVLTGRANKNAFGWHTNIKWRPSGLKGHGPYPPTGCWEYALGYVYADIETMDGRDGDASRVQVYACYSF